MALEFREIELGSALYRAELALRDEVLRKPLGRALSATDAERDKEGRHFVAVMGGAVVACLGVYPQEPGIARLRQMAVAPALQGEGIGTDLLRFVENWGRENELTSFVLHARVTARAFYDRNGYAADGDEFIEIGIPHVRMSKALR